MAIQDLLGALSGIGGFGGTGLLQAPPPTPERTGTLPGLPPVQDGFLASPELQELQSAGGVDSVQLKIQELNLMIMLLEIQKQDQVRNDDQEGAEQTQSEIDQKKAELQALMGGGPLGAGGLAPLAAGGAAAASEGGAPFGGVGAAGGAGAAPAAGGGAPSGGGTSGGGSLNAPVVDAGGANVDVSQDLEPGGAAGIPDKYKDNPMAQLIWQESKKAGADPYAMLATAVVESGLNPKAVGDNGTSFGLYQYHIGGALGSRSKEWAFTPKNIIQDEAKRFAAAGVRDGQGAAAVQRPADQAGYASKVDGLISEMKNGNK